VAAQHLSDQQCKGCYTTTPLRVASCVGEGTSITVTVSYSLYRGTSPHPTHTPCDDLARFVGIYKLTPSYYASGQYHTLTSELGSVSQRASV
jgi:hypothetical protein